MQLLRNIGERDAAVGQVDAPQPGANDVVTQASDQIVSAVSPEGGVVALGDLWAMASVR